MTPTSETPPPDVGGTADVRAAWQAWRADREQSLREPTGWLSLVSLTWLDAAPQPVPGFPGLWSARGAGLPSVNGEEDGQNWQAQVLAPAASGVVHDGVPVDGTVTVEVGRGQSDLSFSAGDRVAEVAQRGPGLCVRVRDPQAPTRTGFRGIPTFDFDPAWTRPAHLTPDDAPHEITVPSAQSGLASRLTALGRVEVSLPDGSRATLAVTGSWESPSVIFHDPTNGTQTSRWRSAPVFLPAGSGASSGDEGDTGPRHAAGRANGDVLVDFNRSSNFPAHFTAFGTCPTPPEGNELGVAVTAGEKAPAPLTAHDDA